MSVSNRKVEELEQRLKESDVHFHTNAVGQLEACYHRCRSTLTSVGFWFGLTMGFPLEHLLYERVWPFYLLTHLLGL